MTDRSLRDAMLLYLAQVARMEEDGVDGRSVLPGSLRERLSADESALAEWRGLVQQARALASLGRFRAPADLDGRVVAALQAGHCEERAAAAVRFLPRVDVPVELAARVRRLAERSFPEDPERRAPRVLDLLVEEEIADPPASVTRRMLGRLTRRAAPSSLEGGLQARTTDPSQPGDRGHQQRNPRHGARRLSRLMPAAVVMALVGLGWSAYQSMNPGTHAAESDPGRHWSFEVREVTPASAPDLAFLLDSFTGGARGGR